MKGNVFSKWVKEFCSLVFVQTAQAFILAIIMTLIVVLVTNSSYDSQDNNQIAGVFAMIALASISKMEMLIKKIFGIGSDVTDPFMSGGKGLVGSVLSLKALKTVGNNAKKISSGIKNRRQANVESRKARLNYNKSKQAALSKGQTTGTTTTDNSKNSGTSGANLKSGTGNNVQTRNNGGAINGANITITNSNVDMKGSNPATGTADTDLNKAKEEYQQKMKEIQSKKQSANKELLSGVLETGGAIIGGTAGAATGAVFGAATGGNVMSSASNGGLYGAAILDKASNIGVNIAYEAKERKEYKKTMKNLNAQIKEIEDSMKKFNAGDI